MFTFHAVCCDMLPYIKDRTVSAHINIVLEFGKLFKNKGHTVIIYAYGDRIDSEFCTEHVQLDIEYDINKVNHPQWLTDTNIFDDDRKRISSLYSVLVAQEVSKRFVFGSNHLVVEVGTFLNTMKLLEVYNPITIMNFGGPSYTKNVVFCSNTYRLCNNMDAPNYTIIHPWVDVSEFPFNTTNESNANVNATSELNVKENKELCFLYLGRCKQIKGLDYYLQLAEYFKQYKFYVAGPRDGNEYEKEFNMPNVEYLGILNRTERIKWLSNVTALIQPSMYNEPFGMNVIEANACGTPVITSQLGTFNEIVKNGYNGFILPPAGTLLNTWVHIGKLLKNVASLSRQDCRTYVENNFNGSIAYKSYLHFFSTLSL